MNIIKNINGIIGGINGVVSANSFIQTLLKALFLTMLLSPGVIHKFPLLLQNSPSQRVLVDKIIAIVNEKDLITLSEVKEATISLRLLLNLQGAPKEEEVLHHLIENVLILQEVGNLSYHEVDPVDLEIALRWIRKRYSQTHTISTAEELLRTLEQEGISIEKLKDLLLPQFRGIEYIRRKNRFSINIQDTEKVLQLFEDWVKELNEKAVIQYLQP